MIRLELSGPAWCDRFPTDRTTATLRKPFRHQVQRFIGSLEDGGARVSIAATWRPAERAWLMRQAWDLRHGLTRPELVPARDGIPIQWVHPTEAASLEAAAAMVEAYGLVYRPSLTSRHLFGRAIDLGLEGWRGTSVRDARGELVTLATERDLYRLGAGFGVHKLLGDEPHWSDDGR